MDKKQTNYWLVLATVISLLFTGYLWLMPGSLVKPVAEWAGAIGTVAAVAVSLWLQFRNEDRIKQEKMEERKLEVARVLLDELQKIDTQINETTNALMNDFEVLSKGPQLQRPQTPDGLFHMDDGPVKDAAARINANKNRLVNTYLNNWQLNYLISEIMTDGDQKAFSDLKQKIYKEGILKIYDTHSIGELTNVFFELNIYEKVNEMRTFILEKYYK